MQPLIKNTWSFMPGQTLFSEIFLILARPIYKHVNPVHKLNRPLAWGFVTPVYLKMV